MSTTFLLLQHGLFPSGHYTSSSHSLTYSEVADRVKGPEKNRSEDRGFLARKKGVRVAMRWMEWEN